MSKSMTHAEWIAFREKGIGGSDAPAVMDASPWLTSKKLLLIKTGQQDYDPQTYVMRRGLQMEPVARAAYEEITGIPMPKDTKIKAGMPFIRGSYDGLNKDERHGLEIKCPGRADHYLALTGEIPEKYIWQCVHLALLSGYQKFDYFSYNPSFGKEHESVILPFKRSNRLEKELLTKETEFWNQVQKVRKEHAMPQNTFFYSAEEVIKILRVAKASGITSLVLPGYEAAFDPQLRESRELPENVPARNAANSMFRVRKTRARKPPAPVKVHRCQECRTTNLQHWQTMCLSCYRDQKNARD